MEPENTGPLEKENHLNQTIIFRFYVNLRGCIPLITYLFVIHETVHIIATCLLCIWLMGPMGIPKDFCQGFVNHWFP